MQKHKNRERVIREVADAFQREFVNTQGFRTRSRRLDVSEDETRIEDEVRKHYEFLVDLADREAYAVRMIQGKTVTNGK